MGKPRNISFGPGSTNAAARPIICRRGAGKIPGARNPFVPTLPDCTEVIPCFRKSM